MSISVNDDLDSRDFLNPDFEQEGFKIITDPKTIEFFKDENYSTILTVLREKPMTVKDIVKEYNKVIEEKSKKFGWSKKEKENRLRTDKTIYKYVKDLVNVNLIAQAGQRVVIGRTITEALFARTALIFYSDEDTIDWWRSKAAEKAIKKTAELLEIYLEIEKPSIKCLTEIINKIVEYNQKEFFRVFTQKIPKAKDIVYSSEGPDIDRALVIVDIILAILRSNEYQNELKECLGLH